MINNKEIIEDIFDQIYLREECKADSLVRINEDCSCRGCVYSYTVKREEDNICPYVWSREVRILK